MIGSERKIRQTDIDAILLRLQILRSQIASTRQVIAPLEGNLALAQQEFQAFVGHLRRQEMRLRAEYTSLSAKIDALRNRSDDTQWDAGDSAYQYGGGIGDDFGDFDQKDDAEPQKDPEALEKDVLLEHMVMILDDMMLNDADAALLANIQGLCRDPSVSLADVLDELPWGNVWTGVSPMEDLAGQHRRLQGWERALETQLANLKQAVDGLHKDSRYGLWQQRQRGDQAWKEFLEQAAQLQQERNAELQQELDELRADWAQLTGML